MAIKKREHRIRLEHGDCSHAGGHGMCAKDNEQVEDSQCARADCKTTGAANIGNSSPIFG